MNNTNEFSCNFEFQRLDDYFIKDVTIKRNSEWNFVNKSAFQLFNDFSQMNLEPINNLLTTNYMKFKEVTKNLDKETEFILFQPFFVVFNSVICSAENFNCFIEKVKEDLEKKNSDVNTKEYYFGLFKSNVSNFVRYFSG